MSRSPVFNYRGLIFRGLNLNISSFFLILVSFIRLLLLSSDLISHMPHRQLDLKHDYIEQVRSDPRKTLCVVVGTASVAADGDVHMHTNRKGEAKEDVSKVFTLMIEAPVLMKNYHIILPKYLIRTMFLS